MRNDVDVIGNSGITGSVLSWGTEYLEEIFVQLPKIRVANSNSNKFDANGLPPRQNASQNQTSGQDINQVLQQCCRPHVLVQSSAIPNHEQLAELYGTCSPQNEILKVTDKPRDDPPCPADDSHCTCLFVVNAWAEKIRVR